MGGCIKGIIIGSLALLITCASLGYVLWRKAETSVSDEKAKIVATQVVASIDASAITSGQVVLRAYDLDVNNAVALPGDCGFNVGTDGTWIYGVVTEITPAGIAFGCAGGSYSTVPVIEEGRVELTEIEASSPAMRIIFSRDKLEQGIEQGINEALDAKGLRPISLTLDDGSMTILTEKTDS